MQVKKPFLSKKERKAEREGREAERQKDGRKKEKGLYCFYAKKKDTMKAPENKMAGAIKIISS